MRHFLLLSAFLTFPFFASCQREANKPQAVAIVTMDADTIRRLAYELPKDEVAAAAMHAVGTNEPARAEFAAQLNEIAVRQLTREPIAELKRKLDTLERRTNRHPFTREQLTEAMRRKEKS